jgi:hypothetical protein
MARGLAASGGNGRARQGQEAAARNSAPEAKTAVLEVDVADGRLPQGRGRPPRRWAGSTSWSAMPASACKWPRIWLEEWKKVIDVSLTSMFVCCQAAYP